MIISFSISNKIFNNNIIYLNSIASTIFYKMITSFNSIFNINFNNINNFKSNINFIINFILYFNSIFTINKNHIINNKFNINKIIKFTYKKIINIIINKIYNFITNFITKTSVFIQYYIIIILYLYNIII